MTALCVVLEAIHDEGSFDRYRSQVVPIVRAHQGRFLARGGEHTVLEGQMPYSRVVVLEFPSRDAALGWYHSPEYQQILPLRRNAADCLFIVVDGVQAAS